MITKCKVDECNTQSRSLGFCQKHYRRFKKYGTTDALKGSREPLSKRFWLYVDKRSVEECWEWTGAIGPNGYGRTCGDGKYDLVASRVSYEITKGPIPDGLLVIHSCDNRKCVNPSHLSIGTHLDNMRDMISKGREYHPIKYGEESPRAKLTDDMVRLIRSSVGIPDTEFAKRFNVTKAAIRNVRIGLTWRHVE